MVQDLFEIKEELTVFLRNQDIIPIGTRGVSTEQDTGTYAATSTDTLDTNPTLLKNIRDITVGGTPLALGTDYSVEYDTGVITYVSPQTGAFTINYDQGSTDRIYPDYPQPYTKLSQFPRIAVDIISGTMTEFSIAATTTRHAYTPSVTCYSVDVAELGDMISDTQTAILNNKKNFYYLKLITPTDLGPVLNSPGKEDKVLQRNIDFMADFNFETV